jgi:hypothetical protein
VLTENKFLQSYSSYSGDCKNGIKGYNAYLKNRINGMRSFLDAT